MNAGPITGAVLPERTAFVIDGQRSAMELNEGLASYNASLLGPEGPGSPP
jgi:hypothetical protein